MFEGLLNLKCAWIKIKNSPTIFFVGGYLIWLFPQRGWVLVCEIQISFRPNVKKTNLIWRESIHVSIDHPFTKESNRPNTPFRVRLLDWWSSSEPIAPNHGKKFLGEDWESYFPWNHGETKKIWNSQRLKPDQRSTFTVDETEKKRLPPIGHGGFSLCGRNQSQWHLERPGVPKPHWRR